MRALTRVLNLQHTQLWRLYCNIQRPCHFHAVIKYQDVKYHLSHSRLSCILSHRIDPVRCASLALCHSYKGAATNTRRHLARNCCSNTEWTPAQTASYIREVTEVTSAHLTPEVKLHLITPSCTLWAGRGEDCLVPDPFWAFYWPGGQALTRYILDHPAVVQGRVVLDVGSGCGASAIAAITVGASKAIANDICPIAAEAIKMNAVLNKISVDVDTQNLIGQMDNQWDVVFLGDMFYDQDFTNTVTEWLEESHSQGKLILIGDPGRIYFEKHPIKKRLKMVYSVDLLKHTIEENNGITQGFVWKFI